MTATAKGKSSVVSLEALLGQQGELFKRLLKESLQEVLEAEMTEVVGAGPGERSESRSGYRAGYYSRSLVTRIGKGRAQDERPTGFEQLGLNGCTAPPWGPAIDPQLSVGAVELPAVKLP